MHFFAITGYDVADSLALRQQSRTAHLERLYQLESENRLLIAGPMPIVHPSDSSNKPELASTPMSGSLIIASFADLAAAQAWVNEEPYLKAGVYSHVDIKPFVKTLPTKPSSLNNKGAK